MTRTREVQRAVENYFLHGPEKKNVKTYFTVAGGGQGAAGQNTGQAFINLADYDQRPGTKNSADAIVQRASGGVPRLRDAQVFALVPGAIRGLGQSTGFTMEMLNTGGMPRRISQPRATSCSPQRNADPKLTSVRLSELPDVASLKVNIDQQRVATLGLSCGRRQQHALDRMGRPLRQRLHRPRPGQARLCPGRCALSREARATSTNGSCATTRARWCPSRSFAQTSWMTTPTSSSRFLGYPSFEIAGQGAPGVSSGEAMDIISSWRRKFPGISVAWAGQSYQERLSSGQAPILYAVALIVVFLCLAALYESWSIPVAVLLVIPLGLVGSIFFVTLRGLQNDVYLQVGLITTMGLSAKNAILMVEFAERAEREGKRVIDAAIEAARIRLRPILMTSFAFIFGVMPLALATGAGANSRMAIGTAVIGGMLTATLLAIFYIPFFFVLVRRSVRDGVKAIRERIRAAAGGPGMKRAAALLALLATGCATMEPTMCGPTRRSRLHGRPAIPISRRPRRAFRSSPTRRCSRTRGCKR